MKTMVYHYITIVVIFLVALVLLVIGTPPPPGINSLRDILVPFATDNATRTIMLLIIIDVVTGVIAALRCGTFDIQKLSKFYMSSVLPYGVGYALVWTITHVGLIDLLPPMIVDGLATLGAIAIGASLVASVVDNIKRAQVGTTVPDDAGTIAPSSNNAQG